MKKDPTIAELVNAVILRDSSFDESKARVFIKENKIRSMPKLERMVDAQKVKVEKRAARKARIDGMSNVQFYRERQRQRFSFGPSWTEKVRTGNKSVLKDMPKMVAHAKELGVSASLNMIPEDLLTALQAALN